MLYVSINSSQWLQDVNSVHSKEIVQECVELIDDLPIRSLDVDNQLAIELVENFQGDGVIR